MADENILPRDQNHVTTAGFANSLNLADVRPGQIIVATGRIKVDTSGGGSGTVTEVDTGTGLTGGPITTTGTISLDSKLAPLDTLGTAGQLIRVNAGATALEYFTSSGGGVASVSGTTNRIAVNNTDPANPIVDIDAAYVGQTSITTLGTIATGTWAGTTIAVNHGGTGGTSASITLFNNITGYTAAGATGTTSTNLVFSTSPTLTTPTLGVASATTINKVTITAPATGSTLTIADGKTLTASNSLTFTGTDGSSVAFGTGGTVLYTTSTLPLTVGSTTIASGTNTKVLFDNSGVLGEYTVSGSGNVAMTTSPSFTTPTLGAATATSINGNTFTTGTYTLTGSAGKTLTFSNTLTLAGTDSTTMTFPGTSASVARIDAAQTFVGVQTYSGIVNQTAQAITVSSNAGTADVTHGNQVFTNSSAATMAITLAVTSAADGQLKIIRIYDFSGVAQTIGWTNTENSMVSVPLTSNGSTTLPVTVGFQFNGATSKWRCTASA